MLYKCIDLGTVHHYCRIPMCFWIDPLMSSMGTISRRLSQPNEVHHQPLLLTD